MRVINWFRDLKIQSKLFIAFGILIIMIGILSVFSVASINRTESRYESIVGGPINRMVYITDASKELTNIRRLVLRMEFEMGNKELIHSSYEELQETYAVFIQYIHAYINSLNQDQLAYSLEKSIPNEILDTIVSLLEYNYLPLVDGLYKAALENDRMQVGIYINELFPLEEEISNRLANIREIVQQRVNEGREEAAANSSNARRQSIEITVGIAIFSLVASLVMAKMIKSPILKIKEAVAEIVKGDLTYPIRSGYKDEIGELAANIGDMVDKIAVMNRSVTIVDNVEDIIYVTDMDYNIIYVNRKMSSLKAMDTEDCYKQKCYALFRNSTERCHDCPLPKLLENKEALPSSDWECSFEDKGLMLLRCNSSIIRWVDGSLVNFTICRDETTQKENERMLQEAVLVAKEASNAKSTFLANMSHEIRTPMNGIIGFSELALDKSVSTEAREDYLKKIKQSGEGLLQIINDILDISKVEAGKMELESIPFNLHDVFGICQTIVMPKALEKGIELYVYAEPSVGKMLIGDPTRLRQVLLNILSNAVKFTNTGIVKLLSDIKMNDDDTATIHFEIKDSGIGMSREQIEKIFSPFTQADNSTTRKYGGTGLGLTISMNLIELMGGDLKVESVLGIGSKFSFDLTLKTVDADFEKSDSESELELLINNYKKPKFEGEVLVCEDSKINQQVISDHLMRVGLQFTIAENGKDAVAIVKHRMESGEKPFDLIFMDIHMPIMDGLEASAILKSIGNKTPIVALTANIMATDKEIYKANGMPDYLGKPFTTRELWQCLLKYFKLLSYETVYADEQMDVDAKRRVRLLTDFVKENQTKFQDINAAIDARDIKLAHRHAHTLKGLAGLIGKTKLMEAARVIENSLSEGRADFTAEQMGRLEIELNAVLNELSPLLSECEFKPPIPKVEEVDKDSALDLFERLALLLETGSSKSLKLVDEIKKIPGTYVLIKQIEDYDFGLALETLEELKSKIENDIV